MSDGETDGVTDGASDLEVARAAAQAGATELMRWYRFEGVREIATSKGERRNLVTLADTAAEAAVLAVLREHRPGDAVLAEESGAAEGAGGGTASERLWVVDPLDGTNNFTHGLPMFCVSVGLVVGGEPVVGVVHAPALHEIHCADRTGAEPEAFVLQGGAGERLDVRVSGTAEMADAVLATGFAYRRETLPDDNVGHFRDVLMKCRGLRRCGSAALDLAWVAAGRYDAFWEPWLNPWDVAAGAALVRAAGGRVTDMSGGGDWLHGARIAATNGPLHDELLAVIR